MTAADEAEITRLLEDVVVLIRQGRDNEAVALLKRVQTLVRVTVN